MYPWVRLIKAFVGASRQAPLAWNETHVSHHICWPWDLDPWNELNNGRVLTLYDLGRVGLTVRTQVSDTMRQKRWGFAIAGSSVRYRRRVQAFAKLKVLTKITCWDERFFYFEQSMWKSDGECASHAVLRAAITSKAGIVPPQEFVDAVGLEIDPPVMPDWIAKWAESEALRPWPPMQIDQNATADAEAA